jgi:transcription elongation factor GreA
MRLSAATHARLVAELAELETVKLDEARRAVVESKGAGDASQNPDYFHAAEEEGLLLARAEKVRQALAAHDKAGKVGDPSRADTGAVVELDFGDGPERFVIGSIEEWGPDIEVVTPASPLGEALIGAAAGDTVSFGAAKVRVVSIAYA